MKLCKNKNKKLTHSGKEIVVILDFNYDFTVNKMSQSKNKITSKNLNNQRYYVYT